MRQKAFRPVHKVELSAHKVYKVHKVTGVLRTRFTGSYAAVDKAPARVHKPYELYRLYKLLTKRAKSLLMRSPWEYEKIFVFVKVF